MTAVKHEGAVLRGRVHICPGKSRPYRRRSVTVGFTWPLAAHSPASPRPTSTLRTVRRRAAIRPPRPCSFFGSDPRSAVAALQAALCIGPISPSVTAASHTHASERWKGSDGGQPTLPWSADAVQKRPAAQWAVVEGHPPCPPAPVRCGVGDRRRPRLLGRRRGLSAHEEPSRVEAMLARAMRRLATPEATRTTESGAAHAGGAGAGTAALRGSLRVLPRQ